MIIDIILLGILLLSAIYGAKQGMAKTLTSFMSWLVCIIFGLIFSGKVQDYLLQKTTVEESVYNSVLDKLQMGIADQFISSSASEAQNPLLPSVDLAQGNNNSLLSLFSNEKIQEVLGSLGIYDFFGGNNDKIKEQIYIIAAQKITDVIIGLLAFIIVVFVINLASHLIMLLFSKKHHKGAIGFTDGFLGLAFGIFRGMLYISIAMAILLPVIALVAPSISHVMLEQLSMSHFALFFYRNNLIGALCKTFLL